MPSSDMSPERKPLHPAVRLALEMGPLVVFFITNQRADLFTATGIFMAAVVASLAVSYALTRHLPIMPLVSAGVVVIFGAVGTALLYAKVPALKALSALSPSTTTLL